MNTSAPQPPPHAPAALSPGAGGRGEVPASQSAMRRYNAALVLGVIRDSPGISRAGIAERTGLAKTTVSQQVERLTAARLVTATGRQQRPGRGRPATGLRLDAEAGPHGLGVEIGVDHLATCLVDLTGRVRDHRVRAGDNRDRSPAQVLARAARMARTDLAGAAARGVPVCGVGLAVPGLVETATGALRLAPNLGWHDVDLRTALRTRLLEDAPAAAPAGTSAAADATAPGGGGPAWPGGLPVTVANEADLAACAELWSGAHGGLRDFVYVSGEIGIGAGFVFDGELFAGADGFTGEIGHMCVDPDGARCRCGALGCLETVAGQDAVLGAAGLGGAAPGEEAGDRFAALLERLATGDARAVGAVTQAGRRLGTALASMVNAMGFPAVVLGGNYAPLESWLRPPLEEELRVRVLTARWSPVRVVRGALGREAAARGAAQSATEAALADPESYMEPRDTTPDGPRG
ncbi:ROK family transcriptional regulator [Streptomyces cacaoi]|uniref:ROK family transcriptional regulator n=1 Tax=Streptomyces cacaoi TaxID=1898 RepID=UPI0026075D3E|nr:ROK family transcriptional regulator [Streptomyces cacaoi]